MNEDYKEKWMSEITLRLQCEEEVERLQFKVAELEHAFATTYAEYKQYYEQTKHLEAQVYGGTTK